jgi:hypothetical protein
MIELQGFELVPRSDSSDSTRYFEVALQAGPVSELRDAIVFLGRTFKALPASERVRLLDLVMGHPQLDELAYHYLQAVAGRLAPAAEVQAPRAEAILAQRGETFRRRPLFWGTSKAPYWNLAVHRIPSQFTEREVYAAAVSGPPRRSTGTAFVVGDGAVWGIRLADVAGRSLHIANWPRGDDAPTPALSNREEIVGCSLVGEADSAAHLLVSAASKGTIALDETASRMLSRRAAQYLYWDLEGGVSVSGYSSTAIRAFCDLLVADHRLPTDRTPLPPEDE